MWWWRLCWIESVAAAAQTPPLGWSTWETCGDSQCAHDVCSEAELKSVATSMQRSGLQAAGWNYVNVDDCWGGPRNLTGDRRLTWNATRFPSGIPALTAWLHQRGFRFGLYTSAGDQTCHGGLPGSRGFYDLDAKTFASWGVDYVKFDWCGNVKKEPWTGEGLHRNFSAAIKASGRDMVLEVVAGYFFLGDDIRRYANVWRFCEDHHDSWKSTTEQLLCRHLLKKGAAGSAGGWASMDLMTTGGQGCSVDGAVVDHCPGQTDDEYVTEFVIWCLTQSPLLVATDVRNLTSTMSSLMLNSELLSIHQSTATPPGKLLGHWLCTDPLDCEIWGRPLTADGDEWLVALINRGGKSNHSISCPFALLGWPDSTHATVRDVLAHASLPDATSVFQGPVLRPHASAAYKIAIVSTREGAAI